MNKKGFTLVELLAVIAILAILVIIALPNVLSMFNNAKKDIFLTEAKSIYKEVSKKYITENMRGNKIDVITNDNNKLDMESNELKYNIKLDDKGNIKSFQVSSDTYCLNGKFSNLEELTIDKIKEGECEEIGPKSFANDDFDTIITAIREGKDSIYKLGDTKKINMGTFGEHTIRIANKSTPKECENENFSQTACGFVIEFVDIVTNHKMNDAETAIGGWLASPMRSFVNNDIYNSLPSDLQKIIIDTTVISGRAKSEKNDHVSIDKLYLLTGAEIFINPYDYDTAGRKTRQLDYYKEKGTTDSNNKEEAKRKYGNDYSNWWLRSAHNIYDNTYNYILNDGSLKLWGNPTSEYGILPAFRIG